MARLPLPGAVVTALSFAERQIGRGAEAVFRRRHLQRLRRTGHLGRGAHLPALTAQPFGPRAGNDVEILVDGSAAFTAMAQQIAAARRTVHLTGWHASPDFELDRDQDATRTLGSLLQAAGARGVGSRLLLWQGAPLPVIHPSKRDAATAAAGFNAIDGVRCVLDGREYLLNCHHEKLLIVDDEVAFVGGLDLSALGTDRWDTSRHPPRSTDGWHDAALRVRGPIVADVTHHFAQRWEEVAGERLDPADAPEPVGAVTAQLIRTIPERIYNFAPAGDFGVLTAYLAALRAAEQLIYLENQFLWAVEVVDILVDKLRNPPRDDFRLVVVLPDRAHTGQDATLGQLSRLVAADRDGGRLLVLTVQSLEPDHHVYVHAKVAIVDDRWLTIGSANLNTHSLFNDTEVNLVLDSPALAVATRNQLWREHAGPDAVGADPIAVVDHVLRPLAHEQSRRRAHGLAPTARLRLLDRVTRRTDLVLGPLSSIVVDG